MSWVEAKHRRSEEKAEMLQAEELAKIDKSREEIYEKVSQLTYDKHGVSVEQVELSYLFLSDDTGCSDYGTDTYRLAKLTNAYGRIVKIETISPSLLRKNDLFSHLASTPASHKFPSACGYSSVLRETMKLERKYKYKSSHVSELSHVLITFNHESVSCFASDYNKPMPDGAPRTATRELKIVCEKDFSEIRIIFLMAPDSNTKDLYSS